MPNVAPVTGRCQCGTVRFKVTAPPDQLYHCHCSMCRRVHGTVFATYAIVPSEHIVIEQGEDNLATYETSPPVHRQFCKTCGCQLFIHDDTMPGKRYFMPGICDWPADMRTAPGALKHIFVGSKVPWLPIGDGLPQMDTV
ncbi:MAG: GFA family protein [Alphaproteobacteria bacterium]